MNKKQRRAANKKIHLMNLSETCKKLHWLDRVHKQGTTYYHNLWNHYHNLREIYCYG